MDVLIIHIQNATYFPILSPTVNIGQSGLYRFQIDIGAVEIDYPENSPASIGIVWFNFNGFF
jgi:hypothetical protein